MGQEMPTLSGTPDFTPFVEFTILLIRCVYIVYITEFVSLGLCLRIGGFGLFAWIGLTALSRTYFINIYHFSCVNCCSLFSPDHSPYAQRRGRRSALW